MALTTRFAGANATAGDTFTEIRSPAPAGSVVMTIRHPKRVARNFIRLTVATATRRRLPDPNPGWVPPPRAATWPSCASQDPQHDRRRIASTLRYADGLRRIGECDVAPVLPALYRFWCLPLPPWMRSRHTPSPTAPLGCSSTASRRPA